MKTARQAACWSVTLFLLIPAAAAQDRTTLRFRPTPATRATQGAPLDRAIYSEAIYSAPFDSEQVLDEVEPGHARPAYPFAYRPVSGPTCPGDLWAGYCSASLGHLECPSSGECPCSSGSELCPTGHHGFNLMGVIGWLGLIHGGHCSSDSDSCHSGSGRCGRERSCHPRPTPRPTEDSCRGSLGRPTEAAPVPDAPAVSPEPPIPMNTLPDTLESPVVPEPSAAAPPAHREGKGWESPRVVIRFVLDRDPGQQRTE